LAVGGEGDVQNARQQKTDFDKTGYGGGQGTGGALARSPRGGAPTAGGGRAGPPPTNAGGEDAKKAGGQCPQRIEQGGRGIWSYWGGRFNVNRRAIKTDVKWGMVFHGAVNGRSQKGGLNENFEELIKRL